MDQAEAEGPKEAKPPHVCIDGDLTDAEVIDRVTHGEKRLFAILMRRYNQTLYRAVRSYLNKQAEVEDAMQEAYLKAYAKLGGFKGEAAFSTWLVRIGINEALQQLRKSRLLRVHADPDVRAEQLGQLPDMQQPDPQRCMIEEEDRRTLEQAINRLPESYRAVYMLREVEAMSVAEVGGSLGLSESNVKVRLHRAKCMLRDAFGEKQVRVPLIEPGICTGHKVAVNSKMEHVILHC